MNIGSGGEDGRIRLTSVFIISVKARAVQVSRKHHLFLAGYRETNVLFPGPYKGEEGSLRARVEKNSLKSILTVVT